MKKLKIKLIILMLAMIIGAAFMIGACSNGTTNGPIFIAVTGVNVSPSSIEVNKSYTLSGSVSPSSATKKTITSWDLVSAGTTGAKMEGNAIEATSTGEVTVRATIADGKGDGIPFVSDPLRINVTLPSVTTTDTVAVTSITGVKTTNAVGSFNLGGSVNPSNADHRIIEWVILDAGVTAARINGDLLDAVKPGDIKLRATIENGRGTGSHYTQEFDIVITEGSESSFVKVREIQTLWLPASGIIGTSIVLNAKTNEDATHRLIEWSIYDPGGTGATIKFGNILTATSAGKVWLTATVLNGLGDDNDYRMEQFHRIDITPEFVPVTKISLTGDPIALTPGSTYSLISTVTPLNATKQTIAWSALTDIGRVTDNGAIDTITKAGNLKILATIVGGAGEDENYSEEFTIKVIQPVTDIYLFKSDPITSGSGTMRRTTLHAVIYPSDATCQDIIWEIKASSAEGAVISGNVLTVTKPGGIVDVRPMVKDGTVNTSTNKVADYIHENHFSVNFN